MEEYSTSIQEQEELDAGTQNVDGYLLGSKHLGDDVLKQFRR